MKTRLIWACLRTDHAGKEVDKGQRGSSAKNDDVDVVWSLARNETGVQIKRTHSRVSWVPMTLDIVQVEDDEAGTIKYRIAESRQWAAGTVDLARLMDALQIPLNASGREAARVLREAGEGAKNERVRLAQQYRQSRAASHWVDPKPSPDPDALV